MLSGGSRWPTRWQRRKRDELLLPRQCHSLVYVALCNQYVAAPCFPAFIRLVFTLESRSLFFLYLGSYGFTLPYLKPCANTS